MLFRSATPKVQHPVYFISSVLRDAQKRYPMIQKLLLEILIASRKMRPYFEGNPITVVSKYNLRSPLGNPLATGRISVWAMELQGFGLKFEHMNNIKSQAWLNSQASGPTWRSTTQRRKQAFPRRRIPTPGPYTSMPPTPRGDRKSVV